MCNVHIIACIYIYVCVCVRVNCSDITVTSLESWLARRIIPKWPNISCEWNILVYPYTHIYIYILYTVYYVRACLCGWLGVRTHPDVTFWVHHSEFKKVHFFLAVGALLRLTCSVWASTLVSRDSKAEKSMENVGVLNGSIMGYPLVN